MGVLTRLVEKITGRGHQYQESERVRVEAQELASHFRELHSQLRPYVEAADPLVALMTDVFNQRSLGDPRISQEVKADDNDEHSNGEP